MRGSFTRYGMDFKEWLKLTEECGTMGCPGHPFKTDSTPSGRAKKIYPKYQKDNSGCSGTMKPCASGDSAGGAAAAPPAKMKKR